MTCVGAIIFSSHRCSSGLDEIYAVELEIVIVLDKYYTIMDNFLVKSWVLCF